MKILFIGGTKFVGRQMVEDALYLGHDVSILQRGKTNSNLFPNLRKFIGERENISNIISHSETFDVVIDTCGYHPEVVKMSAEYLKDKTKLYIFVSTISVFPDFSQWNLDENSPISKIAELPPRDVKITGENYGPLKALCEREVLNSFGEKHSLILRPTIIVGSYDESKRFDFWIQAVMIQKLLEIPDDHEATIQIIDVRALSRFALEAYKNNTHGIFNMIGVKKPISFLHFIETAKKLLNPQLELKFCQPKDHHSFPLYVNDANWKGIFQVNGQKAWQAGLEEISLEDTILKTAEYLKGQSV